MEGVITEGMIGREAMELGALEIMANSDEKARHWMFTPVENGNCQVLRFQ